MVPQKKENYNGKSGRRWFKQKRMIKKYEYATRELKSQTV